MLDKYIVKIYLELSSLRIMQALLVVMNLQKLCSLTSPSRNFTTPLHSSVQCAVIRRQLLRHVDDACSLNSVLQANLLFDLTVKSLDFSQVRDLLNLDRRKFKLLCTQRMSKNTPKKRRKLEGDLYVIYWIETNTLERQWRDK